MLRSAREKRPTAKLDVKRWVTKCEKVAAARADIHVVTVEDAARFVKAGLRVEDA
jgi:hypothetical protein